MTLTEIRLPPVETRAVKTTIPYGSMEGSILPHPNWSGQVRVEHKPNQDWPVDTLNWHLKGKTDILIFFSPLHS